jgi:type I restriction enzyme S subunit
MLPEGWADITLGNVCAFKGGAGFKEHHQGAGEGEHPFIKVSDMNLPGNEVEIVRAKNWVSSKILRELGATLMPARSVVFAKVGAALLLNKRRRLVRPTAIDNNMMAAIPDETKITSDFLFLHMTTVDLGKFAQASAVPSVNQQHLATIFLRLPPLPEQRKIAEILSTWDRTIAAVEKLIAIARIQKTALMQQLLTGTKRLPGFVDEWHWSNFSNVFERVRQKNNVGNTNVLTISAQHGLISQVEYFNKSVASEDVRGYTLLVRGDFAYNKSYSDGYPMGAFKPLERYESGIVSSLYICFRLANPSCNHDFLRHYFEAGLFNREISSIAQEGARNHGLLNVSVVEFFDTSLHLPDHEEQIAIAERINTAERHSLDLEAQLAALRQEKSALMQQLLTGKRRVTIDAPAATFEEAAA